MAAGYEVTALDNLFRGEMSNLEEVSGAPGFKFVKGDILDIASMGLSGFDAVFHMAAVVATRYFYEGAMETFTNNCLGTKVMLEWAKSSGVKVFVNASSSEIYGHPQAVPTPETCPSHFDAVETTPRWSYAMGKALAEHLANCFKNDMTVSNLRYANIYGPRDIDENHVIPYFLRSVYGGRKVVVNREASRIRRTFLYAKDAAEAAFLASKRAASGESFNIGSAEEVTIEELLRLVFKICSKEAEVEYSLNRPGDPERRLLDMSKAREKLGFVPAVSLAEGVRRTYEAIVRDHEKKRG